MGTITMKVKRLRCVAGCWYWRPSASLKKRGYSNVQLGKDAVKAIDAAKRLNARVDAELAGMKLPRYTKDSVAGIIRLYCEDERFASLAPSTRRSYLFALHEIDREVGHAPIASVGRPELRAIYRQIKARGAGAARMHMAVWLNLMEMAIEEGYRTENPARKMRLPSPGKRTRRWTPAEMQAFRLAAEAAGRPSLALAVDIAFDIGQRISDVLALTWRQWNGNGFTLSQIKTGERVAITVLSDDLRDRLNSMKRVGVQIIVSEQTRQPYKAHAFRAAFAKIRREAGLPDDLQARDTRRTALMEAGNGGANQFELRSLSGHRSLKSVEHYVHPTTEMAAAAQTKRQRARTKVANLVDREAASD